MDASEAETEPGAFEALDEKPRPTRRFRPEAAAALVVIIAVAAFAGWTWLHGMATASAYQQGLAAEQAQHWQQAKADFDNAGDYGDATQRDANATAQLIILDQNYTALQQAQREGDWQRSWTLGQTIAKIQPDYRDIAALNTTTNDALFHKGSVGLLYTQTAGLGVGLHLIDSDGAPELLSDSAASSRVLATAPGDKRFIYSGEITPVIEDYDAGICEPGAERRPTPTPVARTIFAQPNPAGSLNTMALPTNFNPRGAYWLTEHGVWGVTTDNRLAFYNGASGKLTLGPKLDGLSVAGATSSGDDLLLAKVIAASAMATQQLQVIKLTPGAEPVAATPLAGVLLDAQISADGAYALLRVGALSNQTNRTIFLVNFVNTEVPPLVLDTAQAADNGSASDIRAAFAPGSPASSVLLLEQRDDTLSINSYDLATSAYLRPVDMEPTTNQPGVALQTSLNGRMFLDWAPLNNVTASSMTLVSKDDGSQLDTWTAPGHDYLVYRLHNADSANPAATENVWALRVSQSASASPVLLGAAKRQTDPALPNLALANGGMTAAFIDGANNLVAQTLDGSASSVLAANVAGVWALGR